MDNQTLILIKSFLEFDDKIKDYMGRYNKVELFHVGEVKHVENIKKMFIRQLNLLKRLTRLTSKEVNLFNKKINNILDEYYHQYIKEGQTMHGNGFSNAYKKYVTNMRSSYVREVHKLVAGWVVLGDELGKLINNAESYNELLHFMHVYAIELYHTDLEAWKDKFYILGEIDPIVKAILVGLEEAEKKKRVVGYARLISLDNKKILQVRDYGHATVVEFKFGRDIKPHTKIYVHYKIPKFISSWEKRLPGKVKTYDNGNVAVGEFVTTFKHLKNDVEKLFLNIPTDDDIVG